MTVVVRPMRLDMERAQLLAVLERNLDALPHALRFEWLYCQNPDGPAWSWCACDKQTRKVVGVASLFPRSMWVGGELKLCGQVGDFAIDPGYRSLGPAVLLQRATFDPVNEGRLAFCYDCPPHEAGMSTFRRLGIGENSQMERFVRPLCVDRLVEKVLGHGPWSAPISAVGNFVLRLRNWKREASTGLDITEHSGCFGKEFSLLDKELAKGDQIRGRRTAEDLNWRYRNNPLSKFHVLTARRKGELVAYAVYEVSGHDASLVDIFGREFPEVAAELLEAVANQCRAESLHKVQAFLSQRHGLRRAFERAGFRYRSDGARVVAYARPGSAISVFLQDCSHWSFHRAETSV
jgi:hypothetical protein